MVTHSQETSRIGIVLAAAVVSFALFFPSIGAVQNYASGISEPEISQPAVVGPAELSSAEFDALQGVVLEDIKVKEIIAGQPYDVMSYDFISNINDKPVVWQPEIHINVANKTQITAVISWVENRAASSTVTKIETHPMMPIIAPIQAVGADANHGYATNYYTGTNTINGLMLSHSVPTVSGSNINLYWGVNAIESSAVDANACSAAHFADAYFAQSGALWTGAGGAVVWADTAVSCVSQFPSFSASAGDTVQFKIYVDTSNRWTVYGVDLNNGQQFIKTRTGVNFLAMKTNDLNTSVFMESVSSSVNGAGLSNPTGTAKQSGDKGVTWSNWQAAARNDETCTNVDHTYPYSSTQEVISGNLASGGSATWNTVRMGTYYPAC